MYTAYIIYIYSYIIHIYIYKYTHTHNSITDMLALRTGCGTREWISKAKQIILSART